MSALSFLNHTEYQLYNRKLAHILGSINAAIFLSELINRSEMHRRGDAGQMMLHEGKQWFYYTHDLGFERLAMSRKEQDTAIKILLTRGLISKIQKGIPARRYFTIHEEKVLALFGLSKNHSSLSETGNPQGGQIQKMFTDCPKGANCTDPKGQSSHIYKEPNKEPYKDTPPTPSKGDAANAACVAEKTKPPKKKDYGPDGLVKLTEDEHDKLSQLLGRRFSGLLEELNDYIGSTGKKYKSHYHTLRSWAKRKATQPNLPAHAKYRCEAEKRYSERNPIPTVHPDPLQELRRRQAMEPDRPRWWLQK